jgi:AAA domain
VNGPNGKLTDQQVKAEIGRLQAVAAQGPAEGGQQDRQAGRNGDTPPERRLILTPASKITPRPVRWVWDTTPPGAGPAELQGRFPAGSLVLAVGRAGLGKSQFAVWMASQITNGTLPGCHHRTPRSAVYCTTEDSWEMTIVPRLIAAGADLDRVFHVRVVDDGDPHARLTLPVDTRLLEDAIATHQVALVVLDPLLSLLDHTINDYRAREVRQALEPVVAVADRTRCLFLGLAHFTKATGGDPLLLVSGSGAFGQLIRAGVGFAADEDAEAEAFVLSQIKNNLGRERLPSLAYVIEPKAVDTPEGPSFVTRLRFTGESERSVHDLLRGTGTEDPDGKSERDEAVEWLRDLLGSSGGELPAKEVKAAARGAGIAERTLDRARPKAGVATKREGFGKDAVYMWRLTGDGHGDDPLRPAPSERSPEPEMAQPPCTPPCAPCSPHLERGVHGAHGEHGGVGLQLVGAEPSPEQQAARDAERHRMLVDATAAVAGGTPQDHADAERLAGQAPDLAALIDPTADTPTPIPWGDDAPLAWALAELERRTATTPHHPPDPGPDPGGWQFQQPMTPCVVCGTGTTNRAPSGRPLHLGCPHPEQDWSP